jgi:threonine dehydrogenase-like Zn-dependent dehydrogenase
MRALVISEPGSAEIRNVAEPEIKPGEALSRVRRVGLCGSDLNSFRGLNPLVTFPRIPGHEVAATIVSFGETQANLSPGMDVTLSPYSTCGRCAACRNGRSNACKLNQTLGVQRDGALTEYISVPVERLHTANLTLEELCLVEPLTVGFHAAARGRVTERDIVAIFGCGGVGLGATAASAMRGARTIAVDVDDEKLDLAKQAGVSDVIHARRQRLTDALSELTNGSGPDVVIEAVGTPETFRTAVDEVSFTGRVVYIGYAKERVSYETRLFVQKEIDILGSRNALPSDFRDVIRMLEQKQFPVIAAMSSVTPLLDTPEVFTRWDSNPNQFTKIMITLD